jgi:hypothetical protein
MTKTLIVHAHEMSDGLYRNTRIREALYAHEDSRADGNGNRWIMIDPGLVSVLGELFAELMNERSKALLDHVNQQTAKDPHWPF